MNAREHFIWARDRAMEYVGMGDGPAAFTSLMSDLAKHDSTKDIMANLSDLGFGLLLLDIQRGGNGAEEMRKFIEGIPEPAAVESDA